MADRILDALLEKDAFSRCACAVIVEPDVMHTMGEATSRAAVDCKAVAQRCYPVDSLYQRRIWILCRSAKMICT